MKQIRCQFRIGRYLHMSRATKRGIEWLHELHYRFVYDHEGD